MVATVIGGVKALHDESPEFIIARMTDYIPSRIQSLNDLVVNWIGDALEIRDHHLYEMLGLDSFSEYCQTYLGVTPEYIDETSELRNKLLGETGVEPKNEDVVANAEAKGPMGNQGDSNNITIFQRGTSAEYTVRRLLKEKRQDLVDEIKTGALTPNAAAIQAGFRHPMIQVRADDINAALDKLERHYNVRLGGVI